jgi:glycine cleavage system aminomethyltransferase T/NADPH-dependent 2,4-dienoyl-CoA reductase/sulfur reductase-like enzyme
MTGFRLDSGGQIDRTLPVAFRFDGRDYSGFAGDTLASALLARGVRVFGRSFKYHRPRGILGAGVEEPNALVTAGSGGRAEPNSRATDIFITDGLVATSQNRWPSLGFDIGAVIGLAAPFLPAGFYYKTFFGGPRLWLFYERFIRRAAGLGPAPVAADPDHYQHRAAFCDLLVVGSGPAGLAAADAAASAGRRVMLVEQDSRIGGALLRDPANIAAMPGLAWAETVRRRIQAAGGRVLVRTTASGYHDHDLLTLVERLTEAGAAPSPLAQRLWHVRAGRVVLAVGSIERPLLFGGNDRPGVMLSSAVRNYVARFAVVPGRRVVIAGCTDDMHRTAEALARAGAEIVATIDTRAGDAIDRAHGAPVHAVTARIAGKTRRIACDLVAMSGGFTPSVHLHSQAGGDLAWHDGCGAFVPAAARQSQTSTGAAAGIEGLDAILADGWRAGGGPGEAAPRSGAAPHGWHGAAPTVANPAAKSFVDFQNDVTAADLDLAWREGFRSVEHLKRYTTLGMATDQGKTSNIAGLLRLSANEARAPAAVGLTTFRPPYVPVTLGVLAGEDGGTHMAPRRRLALHAEHEALSPLWQPLGYWHRPRAYPLAGETLHAAALREARAVRTAVGLTDVSTLAKFDISGPDAAAFLELVCATTVGKLGIGRGRYTFMLREDGMVADDGTVWRLGENRFLLTSSTGGADRMDAHLAYVHRILAPRMRVAIINVQEHWAGLAIAGPQARGIVAALVASDVPRHMGAMPVTVAGVAGWLLAASYSGERAFELYLPGDRIGPAWQALKAATLAAGGALYGLEALELLRIEKGHIVVGAEASGRTTPHDLGLARMLRPGGYVGCTALDRPALQCSDRQALVGLAADSAIPEGAMLVSAKGAVLVAPEDSAPQGHVTSAGSRVLEAGGIALALLEGGMARLGEQLIASSPTRNLAVPVRVVAPMFHDADGARYRD